MSTFMTGELRLPAGTTSLRESALADPALKLAARRLYVESRAAQNLPDQADPVVLQKIVTIVRSAHDTRRASTRERAVA